MLLMFDISNTSLKQISVKIVTIVLFLHVIYLITCFLIEMIIYLNKIKKVMVIEGTLISFLYLFQMHCLTLTLFLVLNMC